MKLVLNIMVEILNGVQPQKKIVDLIIIIKEENYILYNLKKILLINIKCIKN